MYSYIAGKADQSIELILSQRYFHEISHCPFIVGHISPE